MERRGLLPICVLSSVTGDKKHSNSHPPGHYGVDNAGGILLQRVEPGIQVRQWFAMLNSHVEDLVEVFREYWYTGSTSASVATTVHH